MRSYEHIMEDISTTTGNPSFNKIEDPCTSDLRKRVFHGTGTPQRLEIKKI